MDLSLQEQQVIMVLLDLYCRGMHGRGLPEGCAMDSWLRNFVLFFDWHAGVSYKLTSKMTIDRDLLPLEEHPLLNILYSLSFEDWAASTAKKIARLGAWNFSLAQWQKVITHVQTAYVLMRSHENSE